MLSAAAPENFDPSSPNEGDRPTPPPSDGGWAASLFVRAAALIVILAFFLPLGTVWTSPGCEDIPEKSAVGTVNGWDIATGADYTFTAPRSQTSQEVVLNRQLAAFVIPVAALIILLLMTVLERAHSSRSLGFAVALIDSWVIGLLLIVVTQRLAGATHRQWTVISRDPVWGLPSFDFNYGIGAWTSFISLTVLGISAIAGLLVEGDAERRQLESTRRDDRLNQLHEHHSSRAGP